MNAPHAPQVLSVPALERSRLAQRLRRVLRGEVRFDAFSRGRYATDASIYQVDPIGVVVPSDEADVIAHVKAHLAGNGAHLIALELGWNLRHTDLAQHQIGNPIWGDNIATAKKGARGERFANHGTSSLAVAVGVSPPGGPARRAGT